MAVYLGGNKVAINLNGEKFKVILYDPNINSNVLLKEANGLILKDANGLYLTIKEDE